MTRTAIYFYSEDSVTINFSYVPTCLHSCGSSEDAFKVHILYTHISYRFPYNESAVNSEYLHCWLFWQSQSEDSRLNLDARSSSFVRAGVDSVYCNTRASTRKEVHYHDSNDPGCIKLVYLVVAIIICAQCRNHKDWCMQIWAWCRNRKDWCMLTWTQPRPYTLPIQKRYVGIFTWYTQPWQEINEILWNLVMVCRYHKKWSYLGLTLIWWPLDTMYIIIIAMILYRGRKPHNWSSTRFPISSYL